MQDPLIKKLAKLARDNPAMRPHLMPLIRAAAEAEPYDGNADGKPIYDHKIDHGYDEPLAGGTDVMRRLQNQFRKEQGLSERPASPEIPKTASDQVQAAYSILAAGVFEFDEATQRIGDKRLRLMARKAHALIDEIHRTLQGSQD